MNLRPRPHIIGMLLLIAVLLGACTENSNENATDDDQSPTIVSPTTLTGTPGASNSVSNPDNEEPNDTESTPDNEEVPPTLEVGTPRADEPIDKEVPDDPAPPQPSSTLAPSDFDSDGDGFYTYNDLERAVEALLPTYEFPDNYQVTPDMLLSGFADYKEGGGQWQVQYEYTLIGLRYLCAWGYTWMDAYQLGDTALMDESLDNFERELQDNPVFGSYRDDILPMVERARLGDPAPLQQYMEECDSMEFIGTPTASSSTNAAPTRSRAALRHKTGDRDTFSALDRIQ